MAVRVVEPLEKVEEHIVPPQQIIGDFIPFFRQGNETVFFELHQAELPQTADHLGHRRGPDVELIGQGADPHISVFLHAAADHFEIILHRLGDLASVVHLVAFERVEFRAERITQTSRLPPVSRVRLPRKSNEPVRTSPTIQLM